MKFAVYLLSCFLLSVAAVPHAIAQHDHDVRGVCGTPDEGTERLEANIAAARAFAKTPAADAAKGVIDYIPVRFKLFGKTDGTGEAKFSAILSLLEAMNRDFAPYEIQFYLSEENGTIVDYDFSDSRYENLSAFPGYMSSQRSTNAVTIFVPNNATPPSTNGIGGVTLGYYSPSLDVLVFRRTEIGNNASTASHEVGHYLSLPHTFRGWDCASWNGEQSSEPGISNPVMATTAPCGGSVLVELVTRGAGANCSVAGDRFCDTPADYNLGFGWPNCNYTGDVRDRNGDLLRPDEENFMSYFLRCNPYRFSDEQVAAMKADYRSTRRDFLRGGPDLVERDSVKNEPANVTPANGSTTEFSNVVTLTWDPVENATYYFLEVSSDRRFPETSDEIVSEVLPGSVNSYTLTGLAPNTTYYWRVRPFNQLTASPTLSRYTFLTSTTLSGVNNTEAVTSLTIVPNPASVAAGVTARVRADRPGAYQLTVLDVTGREIRRETADLQSGDNRLPIAGTDRLPAGAYFLRVSNEAGVTSRRFLIQ